jgi:thiol-disulfide isomerase/thioredoxin
MRTIMPFLRGAPAMIVAAILSFAPLSAIHAADSTALFNTPFTDLSGHPASLDQYRGQPLIVNFWARLCIPCRTELPELNLLNRRYQNQGLTVVGIAVEDQVESVSDFISAYQIDYPILLGKDAGIQLMAALDNKIAGIPFTVAIDRNGKIVRKKMGTLNPQKIQEIVAALLP